jgi:glycosyltransferase involved in cell wall biosynthesis
MKILVWQWGRRGAGPRFAACLAEALRGRPGIEVALSLSRDAEIMAAVDAPRCEMPVRTYRGPIVCLARLATAPFALPFLVARLRRLRPDLAICAMPGLLDLLMVAALRLVGARLVVIVHDADCHPGDGLPMQMVLQRLLCRCADGLAVLSAHVGERLRAQKLAGAPGRPVIAFKHPPFAFAMPADHRLPGPPRLLCFGRLLPYKGFDLLADALARLLPGELPGELVVRVVGCGPESAGLSALRAIPCVTVENRWVPEAEIGSLLAWSDAIILPYREASQSGVAAAALAAGRPVIATRVGGLGEQLASAPLALLCEPDPASIAQAIRTWMAAPVGVVPRVDATRAWHQAVSGLLQATASAVPPRCEPVSWRWLDRKIRLVTRASRSPRPRPGLAGPGGLP